MLKCPNLQIIPLPCGKSYCADLASPVTRFGTTENGQPVSSFKDLPYLVFRPEEDAVIWLISRFGESIVMRLPSSQTRGFAIDIQLIRFIHYCYLKPAAAPVTRGTTEKSITFLLADAWYILTECIRYRATP